MNTKKSILIVDDDASVRESLMRLLADAEFDVIAAADGQKGEQLLAENDGIDLMILDLNMPRRNGWDVLGTVSASNPMLPVIVITGMLDQPDSAMIPGAHALLKKPVEASLILDTIEALLAESAEERLCRIKRGLEKQQPENPNSLDRFTRSSSRVLPGMRSSK